MARTDTLGNFLTDVANAIRTKKGTEEKIVASDFDTEIENLPSGGGDYNVKVDASKRYISTSVAGIKSLITSVGDIDASRITNMSYMFFSCSNLTTISSLNTSNATNMLSMFSGCSNLVSVPPLNTSKVTDMTSMFGQCWKLTTIPALDTSNVTTMQTMFSACSALTTVPPLDVNKVTSMTGMFSDCVKLTSVEFNNSQTCTPSFVSEMFKGCKVLTHIDIRDFDFTNITGSGSYLNMFGSSASNGVPDDCEIIVADDTQKEWITSKFSRLTNVKTVAEYEAS